MPSVSIKTAAKADIILIIGILLVEGTLAIEVARATQMEMKPLA